MTLFWHICGMLFQQTPHSLFMVRPANFGFNEQTAATNSFQRSTEDDQAIVHRAALKEFDAMVDLLKENHIELVVFEDTKDPIKPDAIFPNNWMSVHEDGKLILYPMLTQNRRQERRPEFVQMLRDKFSIKDIIDFSAEERNKKVVEGTGSLVFDHVNKIAYASRSERTDENLAKEIAKRLGYTLIVFDAVDQHGKSIYHTNVLMCVGEKFVVLCLDAITKDEDQELVLNSFSNTGHKVVAISYAQMASFAGNMLEVKNKKGEPFVLLSLQAFNSLIPGQIDAITQFADLLPINIQTIETHGGGSVRCMVGGIHAPKK
jgi:hypothetical protein